MRNLFLQDFTSSFWLWANYQIPRKADTVHARSGEVLYKTPDSGLASGQYGYSSRFKPWCADLSLMPNVPSGFNTPSGFITGAIIDYQNGRVISSIDYGATITGNFYNQEVGVYLSSSDEEKILFENKFLENPRFYTQTGGMPPNAYVPPCVFLSVDTFENEPFAFGGEDVTKIHAKAVIVCEYDYERETLLSVLNDSNNETFPKIPFDNFPFGEYSNLTGVYSYTGYDQTYSDDYFFIDKVVCSRLSRSVQSQLPNNLSVGFADFTICKYRYPRS